jgi:hypothetical protein
MRIACCSRSIREIGERIVIRQISDALVGARPFAAHVGFTELAVDGRREAREIAFHDVVVRTGAHRGHGDVLADRP